MTIAITGATGHIGSVAARALVDAGHDVVVLVRDAARLRGTPLEAARIAEGDLQDEAYVRAATRDAEALFWLTPPHFTAPVLREWQLRGAAAGAAAVRANGISRVVTLSGLGAGVANARGLMRTLGDVETTFDATGARTTHLRAGWFMENLEPLIPAVRAGQPLRVGIDTRVALPLIATHDIGLAVAEGLTQREAAPRHVVLVGPEILSGDDVARTFSRVLGRDVRWEAVPPAAVGEIFRAAGATDDTIQAYVTLFEDFNRPDGPYAVVPGDAVRTTTTLAAWLEPRVRTAA